jgi:hypothetical protein
LAICCTNATKSTFMPLHLAKDERQKKKWALPAHPLSKRHRNKPLLV